MTFPDSPLPFDDATPIYNQVVREHHPLKIVYGQGAVARNTDPETSHAAARSVKKLRESHARVLALVAKFGGMSDPEIRKHWDRMVEGGDYPPISDSGLRTRRAELVAQGKLKDSGGRVLTPSGRSCIVWTLA